MILVTGGAGFIGSNFILEWVNLTGEEVVNLDLLTYAGNLENLKSLEGNKLYFFEKGDISDRKRVSHLLKKYNPRAVINFAAESHVDRSINGPEAFFKTNVLGTLNLLECSKEYFNDLDEEKKKKFRFLHVSTDEVFGSLDFKEPPFTEENRYKPNSPYSASKASSDHVVRSWYQTYKFPVLTTNCSNNYGPYQFPEKLIPLIITNALEGRVLPIYGDGKNIRDWLYVSDHCSAIRAVLEKGKIGETYNIGGANERSNICIVETICNILDELKPDPKGKYSRLITFVQDRLGHDRRYAIDSTKIRNELGWLPVENFESGIRKTVKWYLENLEWLDHVKDGSYRNSTR